MHNLTDRWQVCKSGKLNIKDVGMKIVKEEIEKDDSYVPQCHDI
jgi:hypothetical protein